MKSEVIQLTPNKAEKLLRTTKQNRSISKTNLKKLTGIWRRGNWKTNGSTIVVDANGNMQDGQHRCLFSIQEKVTFETVLVTGVNPRSFDTIDTGKTRSRGDTLSAVGIKYYNDVAAALNLLSQYRKWQKSSSKKIPLGIYSTVLPDFQNSEVLQILKKEPGIEQAAAFACQTHKTGGASRACVAFLYHIFSELTTVKDAETFLNAAIAGINSGGRKDPRNIAYQTISDAFMTSRAKGKPRANWTIAILTIAWNKWRSNKQISRLKWRETKETSKESMPMPIQKKSVLTIKKSK